MTEWISLGERMPQDGERVLLCQREDPHSAFFVVARKARGENVLVWLSGTGTVCSVTPNDEQSWWQPLPEAPGYKFHHV